MYPPLLKNEPKNYVHVGTLNNNGLFHGQGIKFYKDDSVKEGRFENVYQILRNLIYSVESTNSIKQRRKEYKPIVYLEHGKMTDTESQECNTDIDKSVNTRISSLFMEVHKEYKNIV
ncbi:hypothetical protein BCR32DRAFT_289959 [Anaeromyces robustus]|uniref:Uncharacterized protein n=1 Tax=Anaeromyces robustus TaxID=1754192 RepID=A0A1Y1XLF7_9FUNG|nr:hypothetical protein BCR32DRAFT_289959 [Anaeromyces robustus]|eukprot:ORX86535.1 hypothetical protein BCR32DRAFT_289959 [Anaeromyces robustus]